MTRLRPTILFALAALPLAGCISFGPKPPAQLLMLSATTPLPSGTDRTTDDRRAVAVAMPSVPQVLMTQRVMVTDGATGVAYLKDAQWAGLPAAQFRSLLAETITVRTGRVVPDPKQFVTQPDTRLSGQLTRMGLDGPGKAVEIVFDAALSRAGQPTVDTRRFTARIPVADETEAAVAPALNQAANQVAGEVADWIGR